MKYIENNEKENIFCIFKDDKDDINCSLSRAFKEYLKINMKSKEDIDVYTHQS